MPSAADAAGDAGDGDSDDKPLNLPDDGVVPEEETKKDAAAAAAPGAGALALKPPTSGDRIYEVARRFASSQQVPIVGSCRGPTQGGFTSAGTWRFVPSPLPCPSFFLPRYPISYTMLVHHCLTLRSKTSTRASDSFPNAYGCILLRRVALEKLFPNTMNFEL